MNGPRMKATSRSTPVAPLDTPQVTDDRMVTVSAEDLTEAVDILDGVWDDGPPHAGWASGELMALRIRLRAALASVPEEGPEDGPTDRSPICECRHCKNSDEAGCAVTLRLLQCGMEGGHDGDCCEWGPHHGVEGIVTVAPEEGPEDGPTRVRCHEQRPRGAF